MHIGLQIKLARIAKGLTQQELAELIFKTRPLVSYIEQKGVVNDDTLADIKKVLDMPEKHKDSVSAPAEVYGKDKFLQQELEHLVQEVGWLKSEIEVLRRLCETQQELIESLKNKKD